MSPNRTEILHFRATPEEKGRIKENAGHAGYDPEKELSEWMRQRSLDRVVPTQPAVEINGLRNVERQREENPDSVPEIAEDAPQAWANSLNMAYTDEKGVHVAPGGETYEQFMERRVGELCSDTGPEGHLEAEAREQAQAEWAAQEP